VDINIVGPKLLYLSSMILLTAFPNSSLFSELFRDVLLFSVTTISFNLERASPNSPFNFSFVDVLDIIQFYVEWSDTIRAWVLLGDRRIPLDRV